MKLNNMLYLCLNDQSDMGLTKIVKFSVISEKFFHTGFASTFLSMNFLSSITTR